MGELTNIKGIGPKIEKYFNNLGIHTIKDLIYFFPRDYEEYSTPVDIINLKVGKIATINATVVTKPSVFRKGRTTITSLFLDDGTARIRAYWFNIPFISKNLVVGKNAYFRGRVSRTRNGIVISQCKVYKKKAYEELIGNLNPVYTLTKGLNNNTVKKAVSVLLDSNSLKKEYFEEYLPDKIKKERKLCDLSFAFNHIHFPNRLEDMKKARERLVYDELFLYSLALLSNKERNVKNGRKDLQGIDLGLLDKVLKLLPFLLTDGQMSAIKDIVSDFKNGKKMNRLLEGDVGSGKTIVAFISAILVADRKVQTAFMAPTEVLAEQHFKSIVELLEKIDKTKKVALLTGSTKARERKNILEALQKGEIDILIGTHALFSKDVVYKDLGFCVIDEQHRFGVSQRKTFEEKSNNAHVLIMSATPIPRTLSLLMFADMDISRIKDKPKNRLRIKNYVANISERERAYKSMKRQLELGHQAYVICPAIEQSEDDIGSFANYQNVTDYAKILKEYFGKTVNIKVLHGKMKQDEKNTIMQEFKAGEIQILVSTTVVEVGVDVPNATFIMIEDAGSFGLAELHQLRGRVGRGNNQSYALFVDTMPTEKSKERLNVLVESTDGFYIAEQDLKLRGPGDIFGIKQSGSIDFRLADIYVDYKIFKSASTDAKEFIDNNMEITKSVKEKLDEHLKLGLVI